ncbi:hypothetical protein L1887_11507 [Cichorium endivia]|nr:hypothetical protein L1887_11507 [Cichorium endivia]
MHHCEEARERKVIRVKQRVDAIAAKALISAQIGVKGFVEGGIASIIAGCSTHPLDLIIVRMQLHGESAPVFALNGANGSTMTIPRPPPAGPISVGVKIFRTEGVAALFFGVSATVLRQTLHSLNRATFFSVEFDSLMSESNQEFPQRIQIIKKGTCSTSSRSKSSRDWLPKNTIHNFVLWTSYTQEKVNIGTGPPGSKIRWFRSASNEPRFINTVTFDSKEDSPTLVMVHGYAAAQGFFFRNFDALTKHFRVIAIDQLGFIFLGDSFGGYVASKYALKHPEHVQHLVLVGPAGFTSELDQKSEWLTKYTSARFGEYSTGDVLTDDESRLLTDYIYHTLAAKGSGELCLKSSEWKVPTTFIYGFEDWMNYQGAIDARKNMSVPCEIIRVPKAGHFVFLDNASGFHSTVLHACRRFLSSDPNSYPLAEGVMSI